MSQQRSTPPPRRPDLGRIVQHGYAFDPKNEAGMNDPLADDLYAAVGRLFDQLDEHGVAYVLVGGVAMLQYVDGRNTQDIDLIVAVEALEAVPGATVTERNDTNFARATFEGVQVDVLRAEHPLFAEVRRAHATERRFAERRVPCATVEGLLLLKLFALPSLYRQGDFARVGLYENDVAMLLQKYETDLDPLFATLRPHLLETDRRALHSIVGEISKRIQRFEKSRSPDDAGDGADE